MDRFKLGLWGESMQKVHSAVESPGIQSVCSRHSSGWDDYDYPNNRQCRWFHDHCRNSANVSLVFNVLPSSAPPTKSLYPTAANNASLTLCFVFFPVLSTLELSVSGSIALIRYPWHPGRVILVNYEPIHHDDNGCFLRWCFWCCWAFLWLLLPFVARGIGRCGRSSSRSTYPRALPSDKRPTR